MRRLLLIIALASGLSVAGISAYTQAAHAQDDAAQEGAAQEVPDIFSLDELNFQVPAGVFVASQDLQAPEGPVRVITLRPADPRGGQVNANSFASITIFSDELPGEGSLADRALSTVVSGVVAGVSALTAPAQRAQSVRVAGQDVDGVALSIRYDGVQVDAKAGAIESDGVALVTYFHAVAGEDEAILLLEQALSSLSTGPAADLPEDERALPGLIVE